METAKEVEEAEAEVELNLHTAGPKMAVETTMDMVEIAASIVHPHPLDQDQKKQNTAVLNNVETEGLVVAKI